MFTDKNAEKIIEEHTAHYAHELIHRRSVLISGATVIISLANIAVHALISRIPSLQKSEYDYFLLSSVFFSIIQHELLKLADEAITHYIANHYKKRNQLKRSTKELPSLRYALLIITLPSLLIHLCINAKMDLGSCSKIFSATLSFFSTINKTSAHQNNTVKIIQTAINGSFSGKYQGTWDTMQSAYSVVLTYTPHKKIKKKFPPQKIAKYLDSYITKYLFAHCRVLGTPAKLFFIIYPSLSIATSPTVNLRNYLKDISEKQKTIRHMHKPVNRENVPSPKPSPPNTPREKKRIEPTPPTIPVKKTLPRRRKLPFISRPATYGFLGKSILQRILTLPNNHAFASATINEQLTLLTSYSKKELRELLPNKFRIRQHNNDTWMISHENQTLPVRFKQTIKREEKIEEKAEPPIFQQPKMTGVPFKPSTLPRNVELLQISLQKLIGAQVSLPLFLSARNIDDLDSAIKRLITIQRLRCCTVAIAGGALRSLLLEQKPRDIDFISETESLITTQSITPTLSTRTSKNPKKKMCHLIFLNGMYEMSYTADIKDSKGLDFTVNGLVYDGSTIFARHPLTVSDIHSKTLRLVHSTQPDDRPDYHKLIKHIIISSGIHNTMDMELAIQNIITLLLNPKLLMRATIRMLRDDFKPTADFQIILTHVSQYIYEALPMESELSFWIYYFEHHMTTIFDPGLQRNFMALPATRGFFSAIITDLTAKKAFALSTQQPSNVHFLFSTLLKAKALLSLSIETPCLLILIARLSLSEQPEQKPNLTIAERVANQGIRLFPEYLTWSSDNCHTIINLERSGPSVA